MSNADKIVQLRNKYIEIGKQIAGYESSLNSLNEQRTEILEKCNTLGIKPEDIKKKITEYQKEFDTLINLIENKLNGKDEVDDMYNEEI